ncbi:MAG: transcription antitermination factor NusB, partial [Gaiellales bacterium]
RAGRDGRDRALAARLAAQAVKGRRLLDAAVEALAERDPAGLDPVCRNAVRLGACQLLLLDRVPPHAAVSTAVDLARARRGAGAAGLVNALLRRVAEGGRAWIEALPDATPTEAALRRSYPDWIAAAWWEAYGPDAARALMDAGNAPPELALRINRLREGAEERVEAELTGLGVTLTLDSAAPDARVVEGAVDLAATVAFAAGDLVPMSRSAQRIAPLLVPEPGMRVLDACAAPGGKAGHLAALMGGGAGLVCAERDPGRAGQLADNLARQGVTGHEVVCADALRLDAALTGFDRILVDAPCTGLGTLGSRPDLRWRRSPDDVERLAALQRKMVDGLAGRLAPGGVLVLALCTLGTAETQAADGHPIAERLELRPDLGAGEGFVAVRLSAAP